MKNIHKKIIALILVFLCFIMTGISINEACAKASDKYLVLVEQKNGSWKAYKNIIELSDNGYLMIKAKRISKALKFTYVKNSNGTFDIKENDDIYIAFTKKSNEYIYSDGIEERVKMAPEKAYTSKISEYNMCQVSSLSTLVNFKCFSDTDLEEYSDYDGVICFSKYSSIPDSVPVVETVTAISPTPQPELESTAIEVEGIEFPIRTEFLERAKTLSDWGGSALLWSELELKVDGDIIKSTNLAIDSDKIEFTHQALGCEGISLTKTKKGYKLSISVKLDGSVVADQNATIVKAMIATISSKPNQVYNTIYQSFTTNDTHGINEDTYVPVGDCRLKVNMTNGTVTYFIKGIN
jgi:hypothetical protein